ncbi:MAG TPA: hypothetical protein VHB27_04065 [Rhodopila sp.]|uniref:ComEA family DNA-binding protein n=1 Tax=Rhodopila sp. TaxID=2480087 RepID=UPI002C7FCC68|nr:hypothetical protein [Rhodopila sp.]HVY14379.1 hypothetical protein [Rhodopila sp.]
MLIKRLAIAGISLMLAIGGAQAQTTTTQTTTPKTTTPKTTGTKSTTPPATTTSPAATSPAATSPAATTATKPTRHPSTHAASTVPAGTKVNLNTATDEQIDSLPSVGKARTKVIVTERAKKPFKDWDDFATRMQHTSVNKGVLAKIQNQVTF